MGPLYKRNQNPNVPSMTRWVSALQPESAPNPKPVPDPGAQLLDLLIAALNQIGQLLDRLLLGIDCLFHFPELI